MTKLKPFGSIERACKQVILNLETSQPIDPDWIGGDYRYDPATMPWYIQINRSGGRSNQIDGDFVVDIEVFGDRYNSTESLAFALEALFLGYPHSVKVDGRTVVFDNVTQNVGVDDLPWEDDSTYRMGATYVITTRRR